MLSRSLVFALVFALPLAASAQLVTAHKVQLTIKGVTQGSNNKEELKPDKFSVNVKDLFQVCEGAKPTKNQGVYLFLDCADLNSNVIAAMDTNPVSVLDVLGEANFQLAQQVVKTKNGLVQSISVPANLTLDCGAAAVEVFGIMDIQFKDLNGEQCPNSGSVKVLGLGTAPDDFLVDNGSSVKAQKRSAAFDFQFPPLP